MFAGLLTCTANENQTDVYAIFSTDMSGNGNKSDFGIQLRGIPETIFLTINDKYVHQITEDNVNLIIQVTNMYTSSTCYWCNSSSADSYSCPVIFEVLQTNYLICSEFPFWTTVQIDRWLEIKTINITLYSTKFVIHIKNASNFWEFWCFSM